MHFSYSANNAGMHADFPGFGEMVTTGADLDIGGTGNHPDAVLAEFDRILARDDHAAAQLDHAQLETEHAAKIARRMAFVARLEATSARIKAENEALRAERNACRNRAERDPKEYAKQKEKMRADYAEKVLEEEGREVRAYVPITGVNTKKERAEIRRERNANCKSRARADMTDAEREEARRRDAERKRQKRAAQPAARSSPES